MDFAESFPEESLQRCDAGDPRKPHYYRQAHAPFLLFLSFLHVHTTPFAALKFAGCSRHRIYGDAVEELDWSEGQILGALDRLGLVNDMLVYFTSDHSAHVEEVSKEGVMHGGSNEIYKGAVCKANIWEGGIHMPGVFCFLSELGCGLELVKPTSHMDVFPMVLSGAELPANSRDLMLLLQEMHTQSELEFLFRYCNAYQRRALAVAGQISSFTLLGYRWKNRCCNVVKQAANSPSAALT
ncbi:Steryl-sulfatase [Microtus ochrogaster]|uniref:Steryl-sulfatase n=1 Tax=Microtus ochrogaster TaxID=79684 RepID=A0A8J6KSB7_MICOH|nr:Steryl-sulfatase [Microtus ochrogaster]